MNGNTPKEISETLITTAEAARILGVSPSRIRQFIIQGRLAAKKIGRDQLLKESDVHRFAAQPRHRTGRPPKNVDKS